MRAETEAPSAFFKRNRVHRAVLLRGLAAANELAGVGVYDLGLPYGLVKMEYRRAYLLTSAAAYAKVLIDNG